MVHRRSTGWMAQIGQADRVAEGGQLGHGHGTTPARPSDNAQRRGHRRRAPVTARDRRCTRMTVVHVRERQCGEARGGGSRLPGIAGSDAGAECGGDEPANGVNDQIW